MICDWYTGMHGRGPKAGAPASDAGTWQGCRRPRVRAVSDRVVPRGKSRIGLTRLKSAPIRRKSAPTRPKSGRRGQNRADSVRIGLYRPKRPSQAEIQKKKKKVQTHRLTNLKTQTPLRPPHFVQHSQIASLTPSLISLLCVLCPSYLFSVFRALCECSVLLQPSGVLSLLFS